MSITQGSSERPGTVLAHTPAPWFHGEASDEILHSAPGGVVAAVAAPADGYDEGQWRVDAALIAAAPELLAALKALVGLTEIAGTDLRQHGAALAVAREVIARAEARS